MDPLSPMIQYQQTISFSSRDEANSAENSFETSRIQEEDLRNKFNHMQLKSPAAQINLTAQQHFNNKSIHQSSGNNNITQRENQSPNSNPRQQRSLLSPGIERQFSQLDQFLKETYEKHGISELIRSFVDFEDQLVSTFEYLKRIQRKKHYAESSDKNKVRCFEEINQVDEFSYEAEQNIIHQFLYNLQSFFIPSQNQIKEQPDESQNSNNENFSFSGKKPYLESSMITGKKNHYIHTSRSKYIVDAGLKSKRNMFSDQKMIQSINLNKPVSSLKFQQSSFNKWPQVSLKKTDSQIIGQESLESENIDIGNQQELLKTIFDLRQQIYALKQSKTGHNATSSQNSSFYMDGSLEEHNFRSQENDHNKTENLFSNSKEKSSFKIPNRSDSKEKEKSSQKITSIIHPIVIEEDTSNQSSLQISRSTFKLSMMESVEEESDKENNINSMNVQDIIRQKHTMLKNPGKETLQKPLIVSTESHILQSDISLSLVKGPKKTQSECLSNGGMENNLLAQKFLYDFKKFFKIQMQIQLILLKTINKKLPLQRSTFASFQRLIDWYSGLKVKSGSKYESVDEFASECLILKTDILGRLKKNYKRSLSMIDK